MTDLNNTNISIDKTNEHFADVDFVARAVSKDKYPIYASCVLVEEGKMIGTDGKRIHKATAPDTIAAGCYEVVRHTKKLIVLCPLSDVRYPPYKEILRTAELAHSEDHVTGNLQPEASILFAALIRGLDKVKTDDDYEYAVNYEFIKDFTSFGGQTWHIKYYKRFGCPCILLSSGTREAIIMPIRTRKGE